MPVTLHRLRRRMSKKKRSISAPIKEVIEHCPTPDTDILPVSVDHVYDDDVIQRELTITTSEESGNAARAAATPSNNLESEGLNISTTAVADLNAVLAPPTPNDEEGEQISQQQLPLISPREEADEMLSMPSITAYSTVNYFEPSDEGSTNVVARTYASDKIKDTSAQESAQEQYKKENSQDKYSGSFGVIEFNPDDIDDVSDIENPEVIHFEEEKRNVCFQVFNENLCARNTNSEPHEIDDNDIISLPHLSVVTPEDGEKSRGKNTSTTRRSSSPHNAHDDSFQSYIEGSYNDLIQALSKSTKECGLSDTLDEIKNGLFQ